MLIKSHIIIFFIEVILIHSEMNILIQNETKAVFKAIYDVIDLLYVKPNELFEVVILGQRGDKNSVLSGVLAHNEGTLQYELRIQENVQYYIFTFHAFIILPSLKDVTLLMDEHFLRTYQTTPLKFIIYIEAHIDG